MPSSHPEILAVLCLLLVAGCVSVAPQITSVTRTAKVQLTAADLYGGFEARKVVLSADQKKLGLDPRAFKSGTDRAGVVTTDVIDLGATAGAVGQETQMKSVAVDVAADVPESAAVSVEVRTGARFFDQSRWSGWEPLKGLQGTVAKPEGRYAQVRLTLSSKAADKLPAVTGLTLTPDSTIPDGPRWQKLRIREMTVSQIVRSPIVFSYERVDQPALAKFRKEANLDKVVAGAKDDFEKLVKLMDWVGGCKNVRDSKRERSGDTYAWDIDKVFTITDGKPSIHGHCMSYAEVLVTAASALGYVGARHLCMEGFREADHEVTEIWVPSLNKWVYFDPSLTHYYLDKKTGRPMSLIEIHNLVAEKFLTQGEDMTWFCDPAQPKNAPQKERVRAVGGKAHIDCRAGAPWKYGEPMPPDYDWGWYHGYLAAGFVQMTPRNDFHSNPDAASKKFGDGPGYDNYPFWVDAKTPPRNNVNNWFTRPRDFYWTLDQASVRVTRNAGGGTLSVDLGNSMPHFKKYLLKVDGQEVSRVDNPFTWQLKAGENKLEVAPVDEFGKVGQGSSITVEMGR